MKGLAGPCGLWHTPWYEHQTKSGLLEVQEILARTPGGTSRDHDPGPNAQGTGREHARRLSDDGVSGRARGLRGQGNRRMKRRDWPLLRESGSGKVLLGL